MLFATLPGSRRFLQARKAPARVTPCRKDGLGNYPRRAAQARMMEPRSGAQWGK